MLSALEIQDESSARNLFKVDDTLKIFFVALTLGYILEESNNYNVYLIS